MPQKPSLQSNHEIKPDKPRVRGSVRDRPQGKTGILSGVRVDQGDVMTKRYLAGSGNGKNIDEIKSGIQ